MQNRKVPVRMCAGCGEHFPKKDLVRVVRATEGEISVDLTGKKAGRGAYICKDAACMKKAQKTKRIDRSFSCTIPQEVYERLQKELEQDE